MTTTPAGRRPAATELLRTTLATTPATDTPTPPDIGGVIGEYGGPAASSYVVTKGKRLTPLLNATKLTARLTAAMREHPTITASLAVQSLPVQRASWHLECEDEDIAATVTDLYGAVHAKVARTFTRCLWAGYSPNNLVWDIDPATGALTVVDVRDLDPFTCTPLVDEHGDYEGFQQTSARTGQTVEVPVTSSLWGVEGFESGNLYGRSILTAARQPWQDQQAVGLYHLRYLERFGEPVVVMRAPSGTVVTNERERAEAITWNADHPGETPKPVPAPITMSKVDQALTLGENLRHHSVLALPAEPVIGPDGKALSMGWDASYLSAGAADGKAFADKIAELDRAMARGMLVPSLLLEGGETVGSNALGQAHRDTFTENVNARLADYAAQITDHLIARLVLFNYGPNAPACRLVFEPVGDDTAERMWQLLTTLVAGNGIALDGQAIAQRLGVPILDGQDAADALAAAGVTTAADDLEGASPSEVDAAFAAARAGNTDLARVILGLDRAELRARRDDDAATFAAVVGDVSGMPEWRQPPAHDPRPYRRELTPREERVGFRQLEDSMNTYEARAIDQLVELLTASHDKVARQVSGILRKGGSVADIVAALNTVNVGPVAPWVTAWADLQRDVWGAGLDSVRRELTTFADLVPGAIGRDGLALVKAYAQSSADRTLADLSSTVRLELVSAFRSGVSPTGMLATIANVYDQATRSEGKPARLTTRALSSKAVNEGRADAITRGGIPLAGAQYSAILDKVTCDLCAKLDESVIAIADTDLAKFTPPLHFNCRCVWVWITTDEADFTPTWSAPSKTLVDSFGGMVFGS